MTGSSATAEASCAVVHASGADCADMEDSGMLIFDADHDVVASGTVLSVN
jgi:hypothetical protein